MEWKKLFNLQKTLDDIIVKNHELEDENLYNKKVLAFQVELGELANEWQLFKFWKQDPKPRYTAPCRICAGKGEGYFVRETWTGKMETCEYCYGSGEDPEKKPVLEEYVDGFHFLLSIGNDLGIEHVKLDNAARMVKDTTHLFSIIFKNSGDLLEIDRIGQEVYHSIFSFYLQLGELLGFKWNQVLRGYLDKYKKNIERQEIGY